MLRTASGQMPPALGGHYDCILCLLGTLQFAKSSFILFTMVGAAGGILPFNNWGN